MESVSSTKPIQWTWQGHLNKGMGKKCEGLSYGCIAKGSKVGTQNATFMVGMSYDKGIVLCEQY